MERRFMFNATGGELFLKFLVGGLLTGITFGIYAPWFMVNLTKYLYENTMFKTEKGTVHLAFHGTGGQLFVTYLVGAILTGITFGIYAPWFMCKMVNFFTDNTEGKTKDGSTYLLQFNGTGGALFVTYLVGAILTGITFGIYAPWFMCKLSSFFADNFDILENGTKVGQFSFVGAGGTLFVTYLVGAILTGITFGIYASWFIIKLIKFFCENTEIEFKDNGYVCGFNGTGGQFFILNLVGYLLTCITFGIYGAWYMCKLWHYEADNFVVLDR
jgi:uncharacterized membrane protein YjgN (DUF898 family)